MADNTPNHGLNTYELGETDWTHSPDMEALEASVPVRDVEGNLGDYVPHAGAKFEATDTEAVFYGTGEAWQRARTAGANPHLDTVTVNSAATKALSVEGWRVIDVSNHGFPGDGSGGDLAQFVADRAGDVAFFLPEGTYRWERPVHFTGGGGEFDEPIPERFALIGKPRATIEVHIPSSTCTCERIMFRFGTYTDPVPEVELQDLHVDVGDADPDRDAGIMRAYVGERMYNRNVSLSRRCRKNADDSKNGDRHTYKVDVVDPEGVATHENIDLTAGDVHRPDTNHVGHAIPFSSEPYHEGTNRWIGCRVAGFTDNGFYLRDGDGENVLEGCYARNCGGGHIRLGRYDVARGCKIVIDGREEPAKGCGLWFQDAEATTADGIRIEAPALDNDAIRVTGDVQSGAIRDVYVNQGGTEYGIKATGTGQSFTFESVTVDDSGDGSTRAACIKCTMDNTTFRDVTVRNLENHGRTGHASAMVGAENVTFDSCRFLTDYPYGLVIGNHGDSPDVSVRFTRCAFENVSSQSALTYYVGSPNCKQLVMKDGDLSDYGQVIADGHGSLSDFDTYAVLDNFGHSNSRS
jgi:hypothetical protein